MMKTVKNYLIPHEENDYKPHLLREKAVTTLFALAVVLFCTSLGSSYVLKHTDFGAAVLPAVLVDLTNDHRIENNQKPLLVSPLLQNAARMKAKDMAENGYFAHISPSGVTPWQWFTKAGYQFVYAGENLAINFSESGDVERAWIASPSHHANLISEKFDETGIATYDALYKGYPTTFVVQLFGKKPATKVRTALSASSLNLQKEDTKKVALAAPEVKGASVAVLQSVDDPAPVLLVNEPTFAVAQNINESLSEDTAPVVASSRYATFTQRFLVHQARYVQTIYFVLIMLIYVVLIGMVVFAFRVHQVKHIMLGILLLCALAALAYINSGFVLSFV